MAKIIDIRNKVFLSHVKFKDNEELEEYETTEVKDVNEAAKSLANFLEEEDIESIQIMPIKRYSTIN